MGCVGRAALRPTCAMIFRMTKRIFIVHPTEMTVAPLREAFARHWPEARIFNLIDESLYDELDPQGTITPEIRRRVRLLLDYCVEANAEAVVFNGTTFGPAIDDARATSRIPVLKPMEAMAEQAVAAGSRIAILCTSKRSIPVIARVIEDAARGKPIAISGHFVADAQAALAAGDAETHDRLVAAAADAITDCDVLVLGQVPMVSALPRIAPRPGRVLLTSPDGAVIRLRTLLS